MKAFTFISVAILAMTCQANAQTVDTTTDAPKFIGGEQWDYQTSPRRINDCNPDRPYKFTISVQSVDEDGLTLKRGKSQLKLNFGLAEIQQVQDTQNIQETFNFPMIAGKKWPQRMLQKMSSGDTLQTDLICEQTKMEKIAVPAGEFDAIPIVCKGKWKNMTKGNGNEANYKYWFAPSVKNIVRREVLTYWAAGGGVCSDQETVLLKFTDHH